jgi:hypothetical protein
MAEIIAALAQTILEAVADAVRSVRDRLRRRRER